MLSAYSICTGYGIYCYFYFTGNGSGSPSRRGKSPPYSSGEMRGHSSIGSGLGVQLRNKEGKVGRGISAVVRRSKNMDKSSK